jgi:DNA-binding transcriptional LysR family regulator
VSRRIDRLEARLGVALLQRSGRAVTATEAGLLYRERAGAALELLADAAAVVRDAGGVPAGHLRVTATPGMTTELFGPLLASFAAQFPQVTVELLLTDQVLSFDRDRIDVAFRLSAQLPDSSLVATRLFDPAGILVASPEYLHRIGPLRRPEDLDGAVLLLPPLRGAVTPLSWVSADDPSVVVERVMRGRVLSHDMHLLRSVALAGGGVALSPRESVVQELADGQLVEVLPSWRLAGRVSVWLLTRGGVVPPKVRVFRDHVTAVLASATRSR